MFVNYNQDLVELILSKLENTLTPTLKHHKDKFAKLNILGVLNNITAVDTTQLP